MQYEAKNFDNLLGTQGFSDQLLKNHFTLYEGYVTNVNKLSQSLGEWAKADKFGTPEYNELKRRFGWEWNGMRLHELYFNNMTKAYSPLAEGLLRGSLEKIYGSLENWEKDFRAVATMRGIGWTILYHDSTSNELFNVWVNEHDMGHLAGCVPLLILDVFEHAYTLDYGIKKADYIDAFMKSVDWSVVTSRFA